MAIRISLRRDDSTSWATENPILARGEPGYEVDTNLLRIGNGLDNFLNRPPIGFQSVSQILDVELTNLQDGEGLFYDVGLGKWVNKLPSGGGGGPLSLNDLTDVTISSLADGDILQVVGGNWVNVPLSATSPSALDDLTDVTLTNPAEDDGLKLVNGEWVNAPASSFGLWQQSAEPYIFYDPALGPAMTGYGDQIPNNFTSGQLTTFGLMNSGELYTNASEKWNAYGVYISGFGKSNELNNTANQYIVIGSARGSDLLGSVIIGNDAGDRGLTGTGANGTNRVATIIGWEAWMQNSDNRPENISPFGGNYMSCIMGYQAAAWTRDVNQAVIIGGAALENNPDINKVMYANKSVILGGRAARSTPINSVTGNRWMANTIMIGYGVNYNQGGYNNLLIGPFAGGGGTFVSPGERNNCIAIGGVDQSFSSFDDNGGLDYTSSIRGVFPTRDNQIFFGSGGIGSGNTYLYTTVFWGVRGAMTMPHGSTAHRPGNPDQGMLRYNEDTFQFEGYFSDDGTATGLDWRPLGAGGATVLWERYSDSVDNQIIRPIGDPLHVVIGNIRRNGERFVPQPNPFGGAVRNELTVDGPMYVGYTIYGGDNRVSYMYSDGYWLSRNSGATGYQMYFGLADARAPQGKQTIMMGRHVYDKGTPRDSVLIGTTFIDDGRNDAWKSAASAPVNSVYIGVDHGHRGPDTVTQDYNVVVGFRAASTVAISQNQADNIVIGARSAEDADISRSMVFGSSRVAGWAGEVFTNEIHFSRGPLTNDPYESVFFDATGAMKLPAGDSTTQRPVNPIDGMLRYSTDRGTFEGRISGVWVDIPGSGGGGVSTFLALIDTPSTWGAAGQVPVVNATQTGLVWADAASGGGDNVSFDTSAVVGGEKTGDQVTIYSSEAGTGIGITLNAAAQVFTNTAPGIPHDISGITNGQLLAWNGSLFAPIDPPSGGGGATTFLGLTDTPNTWGNNGQIAVIDNNALVWADLPSGGGVTTFLGLTDTPNTWGNNGQVPIINNNQLVWANLPSGGGGDTVTFDGTATPAGEKTGTDVTIYSHDAASGISITLGPGYLIYENTAPGIPHDISGISNGQILAWNNNQFTPIDLPSGGGTDTWLQDKLNAGDVDVLGKTNILRLGTPGDKLTLFGANAGQVVLNADTEVIMSGTAIEVYDATGTNLLYKLPTTEPPSSDHYIKGGGADVKQLEWGTPDAGPTCTYSLAQAQKTSNPTTQTFTANLNSFVNLGELDTLSTRTTSEWAVSGGTLNYTGGTNIYNYHLTVHVSPSGTATQGQYIRLQLGGGVGIIEEMFDRLPVSNADAITYHISGLVEVRNGFQLQARMSCEAAGDIDIIDMTLELYSACSITNGT